MARPYCRASRETMMASAFRGTRDRTQLSGRIRIGNMHKRVRDTKLLAQKNTI
jgi:hypothetical protein